MTKIEELAKEDQYTVTVEFTRFFSEDLPVIEEDHGGDPLFDKSVPIGERLKRQLALELQEACNGGMAGLFQVTSIQLPTGFVKEEDYAESD